MLSASRKTKGLPTFSGSPPKVAVITATYHSSVSDRLTKGAVAMLDKVDTSLETFQVSGALDLAAALKLAINSGRFDAYVVLGSLANDANDASAQNMHAETLRSIGSISAAGFPVGSAILFANTKKQLAKLASPRKDDCGGAAALAALNLLAMARDLSGTTKNIGFKPASEFIKMAGEAPKTT
jgi:6,7-dimethyl-8-ribityllumazine synthase